MAKCFECGYDAEYVGLNVVEGCSNPACRFHGPKLPLKLNLPETSKAVTRAFMDLERSVEHARRNVDRVCGLLEMSEEQRSFLVQKTVGLLMKITAEHMYGKATRELAFVVRARAIELLKGLAADGEVLPKDVNPGAVRVVMRGSSLTVMMPYRLQLYMRGPGSSLPRFGGASECCEFLAHGHDHDLYYCRQGGLPTVIARYGLGPHYVSGAAIGKGQDPDTEPLGLAYALAVERGLIPGRGDEEWVQILPQ